MNPHFAASASLNRLFNTSLENSQAFLSFYHKSPTSIKTIENDNVSENDDSLSNGSREQGQLNCSKRFQTSSENVDNNELSHDESGNPNLSEST